MAEYSAVLFGTFTHSEVLDLYSTDTSDLEFRWLGKKSRCLQDAHLNTPGKMTPRKYTLGGCSPNLPRNPPTTPVSESRGASPNPPFQLNARALPFIPGSSPEPSSHGNETGTETGGLEYGQCLNDTRTNEESVGDDSDKTCTPLSTPVGSEYTEGDSAPIQTVAVPTPSLPSVTDAQLTDAGTMCRSSDPAAPPSRSSSTPDTARSPVSTPLHSPPGTCHQPHQAHSSHAHPCSSPSTADTDTAGTHTALDSTHHTSTNTSSTTTKPRTWASIVCKNGSGQTHVTTPTPPVCSKPPVCVEVRSEPVTEGRGEGVREGRGEGVEDTGNEKDAVACSEPTQSTPSPHLRSLGEQLTRMGVSPSSMSLQPRGLLNQGNWCYMHAPLQALISIPEVCHLLRQLNPDPPLSLTPSDTPLTDTLTQFIQQFVEYQPQTPPAAVKGGGRKKRTAADITCGAPFRPDMVYDLLHKIPTSLSTKGRQEDAEEFLCCVLGGLHEEMVAALTAVGQGRGGGGEEEEEEEEREGVGEEEVGEEEEEEGEWEQVGPKNKSTITRQTQLSVSPVSEVFGGELRSVLQRQGLKESATVEPFFSLQLDIQAREVWTLQDALVCLATKEAVLMNSGTQDEIDAHRRQSLARLPVVLVLHLKRFLFDQTGGSQKLMKLVNYKMDLEVGRDLLAPNIRSKLTTAQRTYKLWAVVYHHGRSAVGGHYTCDVRHSGSGGWLRIDDGLVKPVPEEAILWQPQTSLKVAYLLFYRRSDYVKTT